MTEWRPIETLGQTKIAHDALVLVCHAAMWPTRVEILLAGAAWISREHYTDWAGINKPDTPPQGD